MCVHACILKKYYPTGRRVHSYVGNAATQGQQENSLIFILYLGLFTALENKNQLQNQFHCFVFIAFQ